MQRTELNDLMAFEAIARERSFTRAAARLGMSASALSHAMRGLEARLGVRLLARTTRSVSPTEAGEHLLRSLTPALAEIENGLTSLADWREMPSGTVRLTTFSYAAETILRPKLPAFLLANPNVNVEIDVNDALTDIVEAGFDAGIRFNETVPKDMIAVKVGPDLRTAVVGTPDYFKRHPIPETPDDLRRHVCINYRLRTSGGLLPWEFESGRRDINVRPSGQLITNDGPLVAAAVRAGAGLGYMMEHEVADDVAAGRLVQALTDYCPVFPGCRLYHSSRRQMPPALRALVDALRHTEA
ncbi:LysR family transcriptional regulator [Antarcticirhabdus aurantiaca]|uniref:LysR family transcriptional regulator n=1 Tax=Antarcticirhabdus aurantiaca TaxID=2606717 RepID=A0ACD4NNL8_9HYPH|nr:LysR family transcriptional regulator [Antarcticirhabdus aurantiaca]WAJ28276.1 LysR family transcriptional regulator [Jeongeuplla avenae]